MKLFVDDFTRADGALTGSALSGGVGSWLNAADEDIWTVTSNRARAAAIQNGFNTIAYVNTEGDTDDLSVAVDLSTFTRPGASVLAWRLYIGVDSTVSSGYLCRFQTNGTAPELILRAIFTDLDFVTQTDVVTSGRLLFRRVSNQFSLLVDGVPIILPIADTTEPTGAGNRFVGFGASWDDDGGGGTRMVEFDNFQGGDVVAVRPWAYYARQMSD